MLTRWTASKAKYCTVTAGQLNAVEDYYELINPLVSGETLRHVCSLNVADKIEVGKCQREIQPRVDCITPFIAPLEF